VPRGVLEIPGELLARATPRESRSGSSGERPARGATSSRSGERSSERGADRHARPSRYSAPQKPIDEFFTKPYEPSPAALAAAAQASPTPSKPVLGVKRPVGLLLGGAFKKN